MGPASRPVFAENLHAFIISFAITANRFQWAVLLFFMPIQITTKICNCQLENGPETRRYQLCEVLPRVCPLRNMPPSCGIMEQIDLLGATAAQNGSAGPDRRPTIRSMEAMEANGSGPFRETCGNQGGVASEKIVAARRARMSLR